MPSYIFDIETNGLLDELTTIHSLVLRDIDTGKIISCGTGPGLVPIHVGIAHLQDADLIVGHNVIAFDIPAIQKVFPLFSPSAEVRDTLVLARLAWPTDRLRDIDFRLVRAEKLPGNMIGRHSLEAWGYRLGDYKGDFKGPWNAWTQEMQDYCVQDTQVTLTLWKTIEALGPPANAIKLEHGVAWIIARQERRGFALDEAAAGKLQATLVARKLELERALSEAFPPWEVRTPFTPKANNKARGYVKGVPTFKVKTVVFNPASRDHIADRLMAVRGWKPKTFTDTGKPQVDESVLGELPYPEAKLLGQYLMVEKRLGQLAEGKEALLRHVRNGRIHGSINPNGANTGRMTHAKPNMAQVPGGRAEYGMQFRALLMAGTGYVLVGCDADALELRCLAGYMAAYDGGSYIKTVLEGRKEDGTDMHSVNCRAIGLDPVQKCPIDGKLISGRDIAKVWFYAFIYGAGDWKLGEILGIRGSDQKVTAAGRKSRATFLTRLPALGKLVDTVKKVLKKRGWLRGLDGRRLYARSEHAALNTLLQSAGALLMKMALVILDERLQAAGYVPGVDYEFVANVHDEWQIEAKETIADAVGQHACASIVAAGEAFRFGCPLAGNHVVGRTWADTH